MSYGIKDISRIEKDEAIARCNWCDNFFYEEIIDERNENSLALFFNKDHFFKGCPICKTDDYLIDCKI